MEKLEKIPLKGPEGVYYNTSRRHGKTVVKRFTEHCSLEKIEVEEHVIYSCPGGSPLPWRVVLAFAKACKHPRQKTVTTNILKNSLHGHFSIFLIFVRY